MSNLPRMQGNSVSIYSQGNNYFYIDSQLASQSIANNNSTINWQAKFRYNVADAQLDNGSASLSGNRWSNGGRVRNYTGDIRTRTVTLASGSFSIGHNSDGTRTLSVSGGVDVFGSGRSSGSRSISLPTIPRNSQVTSPSSVTLGNPITITTNRKSNSFTHTITIRLNNSSGAVIRTINSVGASTTWTPTQAEINTMQAAIPNSNQLTLHITQRNNQVGQNSTTTTKLNLTDANPTFSNFTYRDSNSAVTTITGNDQILVKGRSTVEVTVSSANKMVARKGSTASYYAFAYDGASENKTYSTGNVVSSFTNIDTVGSRAILVTAYDSRGNNTRVAKNVQVYDYLEPNIEIEISREDNFGANVTIETGGTFDLLPIGGSNKNALTASSLRYRRRAKGTTTWTTYTTIPFTISGNGFSGTNQFITLDNTKEWEFEFQVADKFGTVTQAVELGRGAPIMFRGRRSDGSAAVGIGKIPASGRALDVEGDIYSNGEKVQVGGGFHIGVIPASTLSTTGNKTITGVGFTPRLVRFTVLPTTNSTNAYSMYGAMTSSSQFVAVNTHSPTGGGTRTRMSSTSACILELSGGTTTVLVQASYVSMNSNGFTINVSTAASVFDIAYEAYG